MRRASFVPKSGHDVTVYQVLEDFEKLGRTWREIDETRADEQSIIEGILSGEYENPIRIVAFNTEEGWSRDVTEDIAGKVLDAAKSQGCAFATATREFIRRAMGFDAPSYL